jgi:hypothetical protein
VHTRRLAIIITILVILGLIITNFIIQIGVDPSYRAMGTDSGTFAYCGQVIQKGGLMYRDCWDNKPPGVYYLNAAAISLGGANPFAIWLFQATWLVLAVVVYFLILDRIWGHKGLAALGAFVLLLFVLYPGIFQGGNFTETYDILVVVLALGAFWAYLRSGRWYWLTALGLLAAAGFLLKPTYVAVELAAAAVIAFLAIRRRDYRRLLIDMLVIAVSAIVPVVIVGLYWVIRGDFNELWFAVFTHNFTYVEQGFSLKSLYGTARMFLIDQPTAALTILAGVAVGVYIYQHGKVVFSLKKPTKQQLDGMVPGLMSREKSLIWFMGGVFLSVTLDVLFLASSGKNFGHYLQVLIPGMVMVMVYLVDALQRSMKEEKRSRSMQVAVISGIVIVLLSAGLEIAVKEMPSIQDLKAFISAPDRTKYLPSELEQYIIDHSSADDSVLVWAGHPGMNFVTQRRSPTRYIFLLHLFNPVPGAANGFGEFMADLKNDPPKLIVTQPVSSMGLPNFEQPADTICPTCDPSTLAGMLEFKKYIEENYDLKFSIWDWEVYQRIE